MRPSAPGSAAPAAAGGAGWTQGPVTGTWLVEATGGSAAGETRAACSVLAVSSVRSAARSRSAVRSESRAVAPALAICPSSRRWRAEASISRRASPRSSPAARLARVPARGARVGLGARGRRGGAASFGAGRPVRARSSSSKRLRGEAGDGSPRDGSTRSGCTRVNEDKVRAGSSPSGRRRSAVLGAGRPSGRLASTPMRAVRVEERAAVRRSFRTGRVADPDVKDDSRMRYVADPE